MASDWSILSWLNSGNDEDKGVSRKKQLEVAEWLCDPAPIRQTEQLEFTDLTNLNHQTTFELSDELWPLRRRDAENDGSGLIFLGFMRRGIPLQHTRATLRRGGNEYRLTRLKAEATNELALALLDNIWVHCSWNELRSKRARGAGPPTEFTIPRPYEFQEEDAEKLVSERPSVLDGRRRYVDRFWSEFLGIGGRNLNSDWLLLRTRFQLRESWRANELWRLPHPSESKWSVERALLAKLSARLAFSYLLAAWVPPEASKGTGPLEVEFSYQERILTPDEQVKRSEALRRRAKKAYERTLAEAIDGRKGPEELADDGLRLRYVPQTYLGLLDPALDDPDDAGRRTKPREPVDKGKSSDVIDELKPTSAPNRTWLIRGLVRWGWGAVRSTSSFMWERKASVAVSIFFLVGTLWLYLNAAQGLLFEVLKDSSDWTPADIPGIGNLVFSDSRIQGLGFLLVASVLTAGWLSTKLAMARRSIVILPTWSGGGSSPIYEVVTPPEFSVWQGILARPSNRGRSWKTRPAIELGRKASFWWQDPNDRGHVPPFVPGRPHLLIMELRARMSRDINLYGLFLCGLAAALLLIPALIHIIDPDRWEFLQSAGADTVATVLLLLPTAGGALLVRPGEDPIAARLLQSDRRAVAIGSVAVSAIAVAMVLFFGWPSPAGPQDGDPNASQGVERETKQETEIEREIVDRSQVGGVGPETVTERETESVTTTNSNVNTMPEEFWIVWLVLGSIALAFCLALFKGFLETRSLDQPQPSGRQGVENPSRRKPLDVPAPLPSLAWLWGRRFARRTLLRLAPHRGVRRVTPTYSLVVPAEGSRIYTPPSPTILCLVPNDVGEQQQGSAMDGACETIEWLLETGRETEDPIYATNDIAWVSSRALDVVQPVKGPSDGKDESEELLLQVLRLQTANARPSSTKPFGNGGGICIAAVDPELFKEIENKVSRPVKPPWLAQMSISGKKERKVSSPFLLGEREELMGDGPTPGASGKGQGDEEAQSRERLRQALNRVSLDFDALLLLKSVNLRKSTDSPAFVFKNLTHLEKELGSEAARRARAAGSGPASHIWPSSLESPLAGESDFWKGNRRTGSYLSLRALIFSRWTRDWTPVEVLQRWFFDHRERVIPSALLEVEASPEQGKAPEQEHLSDYLKEFFNWLEGIPRVYSRVYSRGGFPTDATPVAEREPTPGQGEDKTETPPVRKPDDHSRGGFPTDATPGAGREPTPGQGEDKTETPPDRKPDDHSPEDPECESDKGSSSCRKCEEPLESDWDYCGWCGEPVSGGDGLQ